MKDYLFIITLFFSLIGYSQSKKEQIETLSNKVDSLNQVLESERSISNKKNDELNSTIDNLENKVSSLNLNINNLTSEFKVIKSEYIIEINEQQKEISNLQVQLKSNIDSLLYLKSELAKVKLLSNQSINGSNSITLIGNHRSVKIGNQIWMVDNLNVSTFRNGDPIPEAKTKEAWIKAGEEGKPAWCFYENNPQNGEKYGRLYNWYAVGDPRGIAPIGWHVPTEEEWNSFISTLEEIHDYDIYNNIMQKAPGESFTNKTGFSGLVAGIRNYKGDFYKEVYWWGLTEHVFYAPSFTDSQIINTVDPCPGGCYFDPSEGFSVRCIKD